MEPQQVLLVGGILLFVILSGIAFFLLAFPAPVEPPVEPTASFSVQLRSADANQSISGRVELFDAKNQLVAVKLVSPSDTGPIVFENLVLGQQYFVKVSGDGYKTQTFAWDSSQSNAQEVFLESDGSLCTNECVDGNVSGCVSTTEQNQCGNFDSDSCLEFGAVACASGLTCKNGFCVSTYCGDNIRQLLNDLNQSETCDGTDLDSKTCTSLGFLSGTLSCNANCSGFITTGCNSNSLIVCGNNTREGTEICDGTDLNSQSCVSIGFGGGPLACASNCQSFNTSSCTPLTVCGNNVREGSEKCDGSDLNSQTCILLGFVSGNLSCLSTCADFNTTACNSTATCGNNVREGSELCDGTDLNNSSCSTNGFFGGTLSCNATCDGFVTTSCTNCGDNVLNAGETCDGTDLNNQSCSTQGFFTGTLSCNVSCSGYVTTACTNCGNGIINAGEVCDGTNVGTHTCQQFGFDGGTLTCQSSCMDYNSSSCYYNQEG